MTPSGSETSARHYQLQQSLVVAFWSNHQLQSSSVLKRNPSLLNPSETRPAAVKSIRLLANRSLKMSRLFNVVINT
ncbi:hypothetical protein TNCV_5011841 [Trichonephila clavipes]|uniref:Uncharacterized protein n=2 Tax=Trichonephila TaxID=2585208 RepID=A0A8X6GDK1_TRICU|nr:hypothetical protein TNCT_680871 [Trichonephila clavata]GFU65886.1 hypothetical protein TNCV_5011841 [Trichonephila clavipes]GFY46885.1 hypothetical protein TNIN_173101 [Trichonephila inaurata madagascariensis]